MLLNTNGTTETNCNLTGNTFSIKASPIAFDILSAKLYSNPILAIVRELLTNAYDSHIAAGTEDTPITVELPTVYNPQFKIRDYGTGLSKDDVLQLYTTFFDSTKSSSNDFTGCFGLGSKTPFAYTTSFSVTSYYEGTQHKFVVTKKDGYPNIFWVAEIPTNEANGLEIVIPIQEGDGNQFRDAFNEYLAYIPEIQVNVSGATVSRPTLLAELQNIQIYKPISKYSHYYSPSADLLIKQGQNTYTIKDYPVFERKAHIEFPLLYEIVDSLTVVINVPIGTVDITPSREKLSQDESNTNILKEYLVNAERTIATIISNWDDTESNMLTRMCAKAIGTKYLTDFNDNTDRYISCELRLANELEARVNCIDMPIYWLDYKYISAVKQSGFVIGKNLLILVPSVFKYPAVNKLCNTLANYPEFNKYDRILFCQMPEHAKSTEQIVVDGKTTYKNVVLNTTRYSNQPILTTVRNIYSAVYLFNNLPKYNFDIEITSINKLYRTYTNHTKTIKKPVNPVDLNSKKFRCKVCVFQSFTAQYLDKEYKCYSPSENMYGRHEVVSSFQRLMERPQTLITTKEHVKGLITAFSALANVSNSDNEELLPKYFNSLLAKLGVQKSFNLDYFTVYVVSRNTLKYLQDFAVYNHSDFLKYLNTQDFVCRLNSIPEMEGGTILHFQDYYMKNGFGYDIWTPRQKQWIENSTNYKKIIRLQSILSKGQFRPSKFIRDVQDAFKELGYEKNLVVTNLKRWSDIDVIRQLTQFRKERTFCYSFYRPKGPNKELAFCHSREEFTRRTKWKILQLLMYGKVRYAIL